jgi:hypothetical protein
MKLYLLCINTSEWIGLGSLAVSIATIIWHILNSRNISKIQTIELKRYRDEELRRKKASLIAKIYDACEYHHIFVIYNKGESDARNVRIDASDIESLSEKGFIFIVNSNLFQCSILRKGEYAEIKVLIAEGASADASLAIYWDDDYKKDNRIVSILNI